MLVAFIYYPLTNTKRRRRRKQVTLQILIYLMALMCHSLKFFDINFSCPIALAISMCINELDLDFESWGL
ncbi:hypothetical protein Scep_014656 [Stephania cephalantha]|uniref:Uncharacterized protein n=1 Tax=Stephania cephalantha TaxID=152367 RepID=A0AAP0J2E6_9MAGN